MGVTLVVKIVIRMLLKVHGIFLRVVILQKRVWDLFYVWIGCNKVHGENIEELLENHGKVQIREDKRVWQLLWHIIIWNIWLSRNEFVFKEVALSPWQVIEKIKVQSWLCLKGKGKLEGFNHIDSWFLEPLLCVCEL